MRRLNGAAMSLIMAIAAGCTSADVAGVAPQPDTSGPGTAASGGSAGATPGPQGVSATQSAAIAAARVQFGPVIGASAEAVPPLSARLSARAGQYGLTITPEAGNATHIVKGYFSTIAESGQTTVIYVWDVLDPAGNRLHRIQGQERAVGGGGEGWAAVTRGTMEIIADRTIDQLIASLGAQPS